MHYADYAPEPQWLPTVFIKVARPGSTVTHLQTLFGPRKGGDGIPTTLCGRVKSYVEVQPNGQGHVVGNCEKCYRTSVRIIDSEQPNYIWEEDRAMWRDDTVERYNVAWADLRGRLRQAEYERDIYVTGQLHGSLAAKEVSGRAYLWALEDAWREHRQRNRTAARETPVTALVAAVVEEARELGAEVTTLDGEETVIRYPSVDAHPVTYTDGLKAGATARGRKAYAADFLGQPMIPGRTRVEHEADRGNLGRVTRSEDPAVWVRWDDDPAHEYRYVAGELRIT